MSREIKFRVWDKEDKKMAGGYDITDPFFNYKENRGSENGTAVLMQFTGLHDKNGKEVYESDIIESPLGNIVEVIWGNKTYRNGNEIYECNGWLVRNAKGETETLDDSFLAGEVIGNIYENPELLK